MRGLKKQLIVCLLGLLLLTSCVSGPDATSSPPVGGGAETGAPSAPNTELPDDSRVSVTVPVSHPPVTSNGYTYGAVSANGDLSLWGEFTYIGYEALGDDLNGICDSTLRQITAVWMDQWAGLALDEYARLWVFGGSWWGHRGPEGSLTSNPLMMLEHVVTADVGLRHCVALTEDGSVWIWGMTAIDNIAATAPIQIASNAIGVTDGYEHERVYIISRDGILFDMGGYYDLIAGAGPPPIPMLKNVRHAVGSYAITSVDTLYLIEQDSTPPKIMEGVASVQNDIGGTLAVGTDGGLYYWNDFGKREENPDTINLPPYVPHTDPVRLMDGVACAVAGWQELYVQMDNEWSLRVMGYAQMRDVLAGKVSLISPESLPVFMGGVRNFRYYPTTATLRLPAVWDGTVAPVPPVLPEPGEPPLDSRARAAAVPDFLDYEQQQLYRRAQCLYLHTFGGETSSVEYFPLSPGDAPDPPDDAREYIERNGHRYLFARGRYRDWALFDTAVHSVFTDAFWARRNEWTSDIPIFMESDGKLVYIDASRGDSYYNDHFPDEFVLLEKTEDLIRFTLIGHYSSYYPREGETSKERNARLEREFEYTIEYPIEMVRTEDGWRFSRFYAAVSDEDVIRLGL